MSAQKMREVVRQIQGMNALCKKIDEVKPSIKYVIVRDKDGLIKEVQEQHVQEQTKKEM